MDQTTAIVVHGVTGDERAGGCAGRAAIVTGGSRGLGRAIALALAADGAAVAVAGRTEECVG